MPNVITEICVLTIIGAKLKYLLLVFRTRIKVPLMLKLCKPYKFFLEFTNKFISKHDVKNIKISLFKVSECRAISMWVNLQSFHPNIRSHLHLIGLQFAGFISI